MVKQTDELDEALTSDGLPEGWVSVFLCNVSTRITDGTHKTPRYVTDGIPFLFTANLVPFRKGFDFDTYQRFISAEEHKQLTARCNPQKGDVLVSKCGTIGRAKEIDVEYPLSIFVGLALIRPLPGLFEPKFLEFLLNSNWVTR